MAPDRRSTTAVGSTLTTAARTAAGGRRGRRTGTACALVPRARASTLALGIMDSRFLASTPGQGKC